MHPWLILALVLLAGLAAVGIVWAGAVQDAVEREQAAEDRETLW